MSVTSMDSERYKLVEESSGRGAVCLGDEAIGVEYTVKRFQGMTLAGLPVPGAHRIDGSIRPDIGGLPERLVGSRCSLSLADGRTLNVTVIDADGRILAEGHGPTRCQCC